METGYFMKAILDILHLPLVVTILIPIFAAVNVLVYLKTRKSIAALEKIVYPKSDRLYGVQANLALTDEDCKQLRNGTTRASFFYTLFGNITAVFPLLGILGTVVSLMNLSGTDDLSANFSSALLTTFLGLIFAIAYKLLDAGISSRLDRALDEADYLIHRHDKERREICEENVT